MNSFYSCLDNGCVELIVNSMQHIIIGETARRNGGEVVFYTAEDPVTLASQLIIKTKMAERPKVDGIIFLRLKQFCYGERFDYGFLRDLLKEGYEVHFAREQLVIENEVALDRMFPTLFVFETMYSAGGRELITLGFNQDSL